MSTRANSVAATLQAPLAWIGYLIALIAMPLGTVGQPTALKLAQLQYNGGGDWYANKTGLPNLIAFCNAALSTDIDPDPIPVYVGDIHLFAYPYVYMTGHGSVHFNEREAGSLRKYLLGGGFLHIDDNYGLDTFVRTEMKKVFPDLAFIELPFEHPIYHQRFDFAEGLPKIHEHDGKPAQGLGLIYEGRLVVFYSYESDLGNGWEDADAYNDPERKRQQALKMGANIISYCFTAP